MARAVFLHIGEPKTGTTYLQQIAWHNRAVLAAHGVRLPGHGPQDQYRAVQDLRDMPSAPGSPAGSWSGEWDVLARQTRRARGAALVSQELMCAATPAQAQRAVSSFGDAEVHVILTVRDIATLLPAEWQETVKHRNTAACEPWIKRVIERESIDPDRRRWWFWRVHDTLATIDLWSRFVVRERIHVVTMPPRGAPRDLLWQRFGSVLGLDGVEMDTSAARQNSSLGPSEVELLRRMNGALGRRIPEWFYLTAVKEPLAHGVLAQRGSRAQRVLPGEHDPWARQYADIVISGLRASSCDLVGDLDDLRPQPADRSVGTEAAVAVAEPEVLDAAVDCLVALLDRQHQRARPAPASGSGRLAAAAAAARARMGGREVLPLRRSS